MWFLRRMLLISWDETKSNLEVLRVAGVQRMLLNTVRQWQLGFFGHVLRLVKWRGGEREGVKD